MVRPAHLRLEGGSSLSTPAQLGYRMPAEWEPHAGTWLTWPRREGISFPDLYDRIPPMLAAMSRVKLSLLAARSDAPAAMSARAHGSCPLWQAYVNAVKPCSGG